MTPNENLRMTKTDTFLSYNRCHSDVVEEFALRLTDAGIRVWLDKWNLVPGETWQAKTENALRLTDSVVAFVGPGGLGPWQQEEVRFAIEQRVNSKSGVRVIPVLLPGTNYPDPSGLPGFLVSATWVEFRNSIDDADAFARLIAGIKGQAPGPVVVENAQDGKCPYRGLEAFQEEHNDYFFGRQAKIQMIRELLRPKIESDTNNRFLAIIGSSGSGKSSLIHAGLVPQLRANVFEGSERWPILSIRPGSNPIESLAVALSSNEFCAQNIESAKRILAKADETFLDLLVRAENTLNIVISNAARVHNVHRAVLIVDQFEEIFTLCDNDLQRVAFIKNLLYAASVGGGNLIVLISMRSDFYGFATNIPALGRSIARHQDIVGPLNEAELHEAIAQPALRAGKNLESGLTELLIQDVVGQKGALPLLQYSLVELWNICDGDTLTIAGYKEIGGIREALRRRADFVYENFSEEEKESCRLLFLRLTSPGEETEGTKRRIRSREIESHQGLRTIVEKLSDARLLTTAVDDSDRSQRTIEVAHEALILGWPRLKNWLEENREAHLIQHRLINQTNLWLENGQDQSYLIHGQQLQAAEEFIERQLLFPSDSEVEFLDACRKHAPITDGIVGKMMSFVIVDDENLIISVTEQIKDWFPKQELIGKDFYVALGNPKVEGANSNPISMARRTRSPQTSVLVCDGRQYFEITARPLDPPKQNVVIVLKDVTRENLAIRKLKAVFQSGMELGDIKKAELVSMDANERIELVKENIQHYTKELFDYDSVSIFLVDTSNNELQRLLVDPVDHSANTEKALFAEAKGSGVIGFVCATGKSYLCEDANDDPLYLDGLFGARSTITSPMLLHDQIIGVLHLEASRSNAFKVDDVSLLEIFAKEIARALNSLELLDSSSSTPSQSSVEAGVSAFHSALAMPVDEILNNTVQVIEQYVGHSPDVSERLRAILKNARDIKQATRTIGENLSKIEPTPQQESEDPIFKNTRVLVVDGDLEILDSAKDLLARYGCSVDGAIDGTEAIVSTRNKKYNAIISDIRLPDMSGFDLFKNLGFPTSMILMTGFGYDPGHSIVKARKAGLLAGAVLYKPFRLTQLLEAVKNAIKIQTTEEE